MKERREGIRVIEIIMAKETEFQQSADGDDKFEPSKAKPGKKKGEAPKAERLYQVRNRRNQSVELPVGRELLRFRAGEVNPWHPSEYKKGVPKRIVEHGDFRTSAKYFTVTGG